MVTRASWVVAGLIAAVCAGLVATGADAAVTVLTLKGSATVTRTDGSRVAAAKGMQLAGGETIAVAPGGQVDLSLGEGNIMRLAGGSTFRAGKPATKAPMFDLLQGDLLARLAKQPPGGKVTVRTPTGVAGVEGTVFGVHVEPGDKSTEVTVLNGEVAFGGAREPKKHVSVGERQTARSVLWTDAVFRATGTGVALAPAPGGPALADGEPVIVVAVGVFIPKDATSPEVAEAAAEYEAREKALAELVNRLARRRIGMDQTVGSVLLSKEGDLRKVIDFANKATITGRRKTDDGRLIIELSLDLKGFTALVPGGADVFVGSIKEMTRVEYGKAFGGRNRLMTAGAARQDAQRKLVERLHGVVVDSTTTVQDLATADDTIRTRTQGLLRGAKIVATRYFADGSVEVDMEVSGERYLAALDPDKTGRLGQHYLSKPESGDLSVFMRFHGFAD